MASPEPNCLRIFLTIVLSGTQTGQRSRRQLAPTTISRPSLSCLSALVPRCPPSPILSTLGAPWMHLQAGARTSRLISGESRCEKPLEFTPLDELYSSCRCVGAPEGKRGSGEVASLADSQAAPVPLPL